MDRGRLLDPAGNARVGEEIEVGARVSDWADTEQAGWLWRATTGADGEFRFDDLPSGRLYVRWVMKEAGLVTRDLETRVFLAQGTMNEIDLAPEGWTTLRGVIELSLSDGKSASGAAVVELPVSGVVQVELDVATPR